MKNNFPVLSKTIEVIVLFFTVSLVNINSLVRFRQFPEVGNYSDHEWDFIAVAIITIILMMFLLRKNQLQLEFFAAWQSSKPLIYFLIYAVLTLLWTVYFSATLYKLIFLFFSTLAGSYIAIRYKYRGVIQLFTWIGGIFTIVSILVVAYFPFIGIMQKAPFIGSWTGIFWHRNHAGNLFAYINAVFLMLIISNISRTLLQKVIYALFYILSALMVIGSRSATGVIVFLFMHIVLGVAFSWLRFHDRMKAWHYYVIIGIFLVGFLIFVTNTGFFFSLLGRSPTMTGRVPVWEDLFQNFYLNKPILGYGYGALWMQKRFRILMEIRHHWSNQVYFADNGFFDILLNNGLAGFVLFLVIYISLGVRSFKQFITTKSWIDFLPFLTFLYIFVGNLTYSFLLEVDQFVWMLLVIMVFLITSQASNKIPQP